MSNYRVKIQHNGRLTDLPKVKTLSKAMKQVNAIKAAFPEIMEETTFLIFSKTLAEVMVVDGKPQHGRVYWVSDGEGMSRARYDGNRDRFQPTSLDRSSIPASEVQFYSA